MKQLKVMMAITTATMMSACAHQQTFLQGMVMNDEIAFAPLQREDYKIIGPVIGEACWTYIGLFPIPFWWTELSAPDSTGGLTGYVGSVHESQVQSVEIEGSSQTIPVEVGAAVQAAIASAPTADGILLPRFTVTTKKILPWFQRDCAVVRGKGFEILTDIQKRNRAEEELDTGIISNEPKPEAPKDAEAPKEKKSKKSKEGKEAKDKDASPKADDAKAAPAKADAAATAAPAAPATGAAPAAAPVPAKAEPAKQEPAKAESAPAPAKTDSLFDE